MSFIFTLQNWLQMNYVRMLASTVLQYTYNFVLRLDFVLQYFRRP